MNNKLNVITIKRFLFNSVFLLAGLLLYACEPNTQDGLDVGDKAPNFTLPNALGGYITLSDYKYRQPVLLYFHMAVG
jgi:hypothetical protein